MAQQATPPLEATSPIDGNVRKRVCKACDRCRLKKSKVLAVADDVSVQADPSSVMEPTHVVDVKPIMPSVFLANARSHTIKSTLKGKFHCA
jgi:hypothetical protein